MTELRTFVRVMKALADPTRTKILMMLMAKPLCVCEITSVLGVSQPGVSRHLRVLEDADLLRSERDGLWINYRVAGPGDEINPVARSVLKELPRWLGKDPEVAQVAQRAVSVDRTSLRARENVEA